MAIMGVEKTLELPDQYALFGTVQQNRIVQLLRLSEHVSLAPASPPLSPKVEVATRRDGNPVVVVHRRSQATPSGEVLLRCAGVKKGPRWLSPVAVVASEESREQAGSRCEAARSSWHGAFAFRTESAASSGLRPPQIGALYAALAHATVTEEPATIVLPTGTGKTETMLALLICQRPKRLLVVVPWTLLRDQTVRKVETLGLLRQLGVLGDSAQYPVVGTLTRSLPNVSAARDFFERCNVVVATMAALVACPGDVRETIAEVVSHLFIDEAHHISARTWSEFRRHFLGKKPILQFTATPFRTDGRPVEGRVIYRFPLRKAQSMGYFRPIRFRPVLEYGSRANSDHAIARAALDQLDADTKGGLRHLVLARVDSIPRAKEVHALYQTLGAATTPLIIHSQLSPKQRRNALSVLKSRTPRVIVCVDMLGEGFDLPELKIAAVHDPHKSLAITLQFAGRFVRPAPTDIGDATLIANIADPGVEESLEDLYAEDADWNALLPELSEGPTARQARRSEFVAGFTDPPERVSLQSIFPKMSTVIYQAQSGKWDPEAILDVIKPSRLYAGPSVHHQEKVALFITREEGPITWGSVRDLRNTTWDLYLLHFDAGRRLLFINSSNNDSLHGDLARAVAGSGATILDGERVFRALDGINRLMLMNLGLRHVVSRLVNFTMYVGSDIKQAVTEAHAANKTKANLFGRGFAGGGRASVGCSYKGRLWSHRIAEDIPQWMDWCHEMASKLLDDAISTETILNGVLYPEKVDDRPPLMPVSVEWPEWLQHEPEHAVWIELDGVLAAMLDTEISLVSPAASGPLRFRISNPDKAVDLALRFDGGQTTYAVVGSGSGLVQVGRHKRSLLEFFEANGPIFRFEDGSALQGNRLVRLQKTQPSFYEASRIEAWDWSGTDLRKESQTSSKLPDSIQRRVLDELLSAGSPIQYDIVFDDDGKGEAADIIGIKVEGDRAVVDLYHCKYSSGDTPGARLGDLYEVCGQAQKSVYRRGDLEKLFDHMQRREAHRAEKQGVSRFERGDQAALQQVRRRVRFLEPAVTIVIVQPGLCASQLQPEHLTLLGVTELFLRETYEVPFRVIASA